MKSIGELIEDLESENAKLKKAASRQSRSKALLDASVRLRDAVNVWLLTMNEGKRWTADGAFVHNVQALEELRQAATAMRVQIEESNVGSDASASPPIASTGLVGGGDK